MSDSTDTFGSFVSDSTSESDSSVLKNHSAQSASSPKADSSPHVGRLDIPVPDLGQLQAKADMDQSLEQSSLQAPTPPVKTESMPADVLKFPSIRAREKRTNLNRYDRSTRPAISVNPQKRSKLKSEKRRKIMLYGWMISAFVNAMLLVYLAVVGAFQNDRPKPVELLVDASQEIVSEDLVEFNLPSASNEFFEDDETESTVETLALEFEDSLVIEPTEFTEPVEVFNNFEGEDLFGDVVTGNSDRKGTGEKGKTSFFGIEAAGDRVVYVVDVSGSMIAEHRFRRAVYELGQSLRGLTEDQEFLVVLYSHHIYPMLDTPLKETKPIRATPENVVKVIRWAELQSPNGGTLPATAMRGALEVRPSAVFLLSDGEIVDDTLETLRKLNVDDSGKGIKKVPVHTITLGSTGLGAGVMKRIAGENDGRFVWVK